ncbi:MAG: SurA N-terminal domain-containing protein [Candidatus Omnitrophota bacterium]
MLKPLRNKKLMQIVMWALVSCFAIWGAGSAMQGRKSYAGIVFGKKIYVPEFNQNYKAVLSRAKLTYGDKLPQFEKFLNLKQQAWDRIILIREAKKRHIKTSSKEVVERIATLPLFQRNGAFAPRLYQYITMNYLRATPHEFELSVKDDINIEKLNMLVTKDTALSEEDIISSYKDENEKADVSYLIINSRDYADKVTVDQDEIASFYKDNQEDYKSPILTNVRYLAVPFDSENETDKDEAKFQAEEIMLFAKKNKSLKAAAKEFNLKIKETGFFSINSNIPEIGLSYEFAIAALQIQGKEISDIIETSDSFCIIELIEKKSPQTLPLEEVREKVEDHLKMEKAKTRTREVADEILIRIEFEYKTLEDIAAE